MTATTHTLDASGKPIGRVATEAAKLLMGKNLPSFRRNTIPAVRVIITNSGKAAVSERKLRQKTYTRYSGYPGGLKIIPLKDLAAKRGFREAVRLAVYGMLPGNKLRPLMMKNLTVEE